MLYEFAEKFKFKDYAFLVSGHAETFETEIIPFLSLGSRKTSMLALCFILD